MRDIYILHKPLANGPNFLAECGAEHHNLLLVRSCAENFLHIPTHVCSQTHETKGNSWKTSLKVIFFLEIEWLHYENQTIETDKQNKTAKMTIQRSCSQTAPCSSTSSSPSSPCACTATSSSSHAVSTQEALLFPSCLFVAASEVLLPNWAIHLWNDRWSGNHSIAEGLRSLSSLWERPESSSQSSWTRVAASLAWITRTSFRNYCRFASFGREKRNIFKCTVHSFFVATPCQGP